MSQAGRVVVEGLPLPPRRLAYRVGCPRDSRRPLTLYESRGRDVRRAVLDALPAGYTFEGRRVLDFGCGAGRVLRHFLDESATAELWGCDIDEPSVRWLESNLCPPLHVFRNGESPPLPRPDAYFDLVWALSVFPHLTDQWSRWLLELHRVLKPDGLLLATYMGESQSMAIAREPWSEDRIGMNVVRPANSWEYGGPMVLHSPWWLTAHWGRAFDVLTLRPHGFSRDGPAGQGWLLLRRKVVDLSPDDLERLEPGEHREVAALQHNVGQLRRQLVEVEASRSWRLTRPLRTVAASWATARRRLRP